MLTVNFSTLLILIPRLKYVAEEKYHLLATFTGKGLDNTEFNLKERDLKVVEKILIIDDEPEMLQVLNRILTRKGYEVHSAVGGEDGLRSIEETMFDLIISDLAMEDLSGLELLEIVR